MVIDLALKSRTIPSFSIELHPNDEVKHWLAHLSVVFEHIGFHQELFAIAVFEEPNRKFSPSFCLEDSI